ncbi:putative SCAN domain-containing protein SCAND2P [Acipenser ruthenus]|uniref:putative SCAN domain-containing protein SCAND2P n=1 Tax=Acipenser ruthenus TaxID=7906 RepID=UPI002742754A|nr:putative SCAN domain-containing protein SCAND2P [Acipenser ruthenus]
MASMMERMNSMFLEANRGGGPATEPTSPVPRIRVVKMSLEDDPEAYLAILQRLDITEETHRRRFWEYQRPPGLRPRVMAQQLVDHVTQWLCPGTNSAEKVTELIAIEQFVKVLGPDTWTWVSRLRPTTLDAAVRLAEGFEDALPSAPVDTLPAPASSRPRAAAPEPPPPCFTPTTHGPALQRHPMGGLPPTQCRARATPSGVRAEYPSRCQIGNGTRRLRGHPFAPPVTGARRSVTWLRIVRRPWNVG